MNVNPFSYLIEKLKGKADKNTVNTFVYETLQRNTAHTLTFSGTTVKARRSLGYILITGQGGVSIPIYFCVQGINDVDAATATFAVSSNSEGVTGGTGSINIPANVYGGWGNIEVYQCRNRLDGVTITG